MNGYQLTKEVRSGGTLSSLFSFLSLFTDEIKLSWQEDARQHTFLEPRHAPHLRLVTLVLVRVLENAN